MPTLQQLKYLVAVADTLSFSRAAAMCNVSQPTLSVQLKELEAKLGARLVERTRSRVIVTQLGVEVVRRARMISAEIEDIKEIARREDPNAPPALLQLGVVQTVGAYALSVAMPELQSCFPDMRFWVREEREDVLLRQLVEGVHDLVLLADEQSRPDLESHHLIAEPLHVVLPVKHPLARKTLISPRDLAGETILTMERGKRLHGDIVTLCKAVGARQASDYEGTTLDTLRQMVAVGMGLTLLPALYVRSEVDREQLVVARPLSDLAPVRKLSAVWRKNAPRAETYRAAAAIFRRALAPWDVVEVSKAILSRSPD